MNPYQVNQWEFWINAFAPSIPSVLSVIAGFFIFHRLALIRQKRQEIFEQIKLTKPFIEKAIDSATECWKLSGIAAVSDGKVLQLRGTLLVLDNYVLSLCNLSSKFENVKPALIAFKKSVDEYEDEKGQLISVDDKNRPASNIGLTTAFSESGKLRHQIDAAFKTV